jgi:hypothetical protein
MINVAQKGKDENLGSVYSHEVAPLIYTVFSQRKNVKVDCTVKYEMHLMKNGVFWEVTPCGSCKN